MSPPYFGWQEFILLCYCYFETQDFLGEVKDPDGDINSYKKGTATVQDTLVETGESSYVKIDAGKVTAVKLVNATRGVQTTTKGAVEVEELKRGSVN